jgi:XTP/dITP diphosphohydrolase
VLDTESRTVLFVASSNPGKLREFREAAESHGVVVEALPGFDELPICVEDGTTFEENARKKAVHYSRNATAWVFADDSGICVDLLEGAPGVHSARFAGPYATDAENNAGLLAEIHEAELRFRADTGVTPPQSSAHRTAHYVCSIALAKAGEVHAVVEGRADGVIIDEPRGTGGFGYDPYFLYPSAGLTFAELRPEEKFVVSHRGAAFRKLLEFLDTLRK